MQHSYDTSSQQPNITVLGKELSMPDNHAKAYLNIAYVNIVATQAGYTCDIPKDYGVDAKISEISTLPNGKLFTTGYEFAIQAKATHTFEKTEQSIHYDIEAEAYNKLAAYKGGLIVLVLFCVPEEWNERVSLTEEALILKNCCYWYRITEHTTNARRKTLHIPRAQIFNSQSCMQLMAMTKNCEWQK